MAAFDQTERYTDWSESHQQAHDASRASAQHAGPVIVEKNEPDQNTAQVNPALKLARLTDKGAVQWIQVPVIKSAPLLQLGGGGVHITIPVQKGDEGLAIYADRGIDNWWAQGGVQQQDQSRMNQWSDAFIIPGFHSQPNKLKNVDGTSMQMRTTDGKTSFGFNPSQGGSMTMTAPNNPTTMVGKGFNTNVQSQSHNVPNGVSYTTPSINVSGKVDAKGGFFVNGRPVGSGSGGGGDGGGGASSSAGETPPTTPIIGDFWWDSVGGQLYIWYNDNTSSQWVAATNQPGPKGDPGTPGATGARGPTGSQGPAGAQGPIGPIGPQGVPGTPSTVPGPVGPPGPQGAEGVQGPIGPIGAQGYPGTGAYVTGPGLKIDLGTYPATMDVATPYLPLYGGVMSGVLVLAGPPLNPLEAATKAYTDAAVAGLAPLASPVFTGNPTAPTPPTADNDTSIATTAWVNLQGFLVAAGASYLPISGGTLTGTLVLPPGTVTATSLNFGTPGTGIWTSAAATQINFAAGGLNRVAISSASVNCAVPIIAPLGTVAAPSLTFVGDTTSGFFRKVAGSVSISATNSEVMNWAAASKTTTAYGPLLLAANPSAPLEATAKQYVDAADALALSITAAASTYAPLASPLFTGNPRGPTPATADSSVSLATTAFVKAQGYVLGGPYLPISGGTMTGQLNTSPSAGVISQSSFPTLGLMVYGAGGAGDASYIVFHRPNQYAIAFGLDTDNQMAWGGWSMGAARRVLWDTGNFNPGNYLLLSGGTITGGLTCAAISASSLNLSGSLTVTGPTAANGWFSTGINSGANPSGTAPFAVSWNRSQGSGEVDFWNTYPSGAGYGSYYFYQMSGSTPILAAQIGPSGILIGGTLNAGAVTSPNYQATGTGAWIGFANRSSPGSGDWGWYATSGIARLYNGADRFWVEADGTTNAGGNLYVTGSARVQGGGDWGASTAFGSFTSQYLRFAITSGDAAASGAIAYRQYDGGALAILGAGVNGSRWVHMWDNLKVDSFLNVLGDIQGNGNITAYGGQIVCYNSNLNGFYCANNNGHYIRMYDDSQGHIEIASGTLYICYTNNCATYFGGSIQAADIYSRGNLNTAGSLGGSGLYLYLNGWGNGSVNGNGGPLVYGDGNYLILKPGSANLGVEMRNYGGARIFFADGGGNCSCPGNLSSTGGSIGVNGIWWGNSGGWWWTGTPVHTDSAVQAGLWITAGTDISAGGQLSCSGNLNVSGVSYLNGSQTRVHGTNASDSLTVTSSDYSKFLTIKPETQGDWCQIGYYCAGHWGTVHCIGQWYYDSNINCGDFYSRGNMNTAGSVYCAGLQFYNNGGTWWTPNPIHSDGGIQGNGDFSTSYARYLAYTGGVTNAFWSGSGAGDSVFYAGNGGMTAVAFNAYSDARLKTNIAESRIGLACILGLAPKTFHRLATPDREELGLIAQEVQAILPQAVKLIETTMGDEPRLAIDYAQITAALINAVKELTGELTAVKARLTQLEH